MTTHIHRGFWNWADAYFGGDIDKIDIDALYDRTLTVEENINLFKESYPMVVNKTPKKTAKDTATKKPKEIDLDKHTFIAIIGDRHTAKTNLMFKHLREYDGTRQVYLLGYPKAVEGMKALSNMQDLMNLRDAVIGIDELQKHFKLYDKRANEELMEFLSTAVHYNVTIVGTTPMSQFITKGVEGMVDVWNMTRIRDLKSLKNGSKPKRIIQDTKHPSCNSWSLSLANGEYLQFGECLNFEDNGVKTFADQGIAKDWK